MGLIVPPAIPMVTAEGDILNYDYASSLTFTIEFNEVVSGINHQMLMMNDEIK